MAKKTPVLSERQQLTIQAIIGIKEMTKDDSASIRMLGPDHRKMLGALADSYEELLTQFGEVCRELDELKGLREARRQGGLKGGKSKSQAKLKALAQNRRKRWPKKKKLDQA